MRRRYEAHTFTRFFYKLVARQNEVHLKTNCSEVSHKLSLPRMDVAKIIAVYMCDLQPCRDLLSHIKRNFETTPIPPIQTHLICINAFIKQPLDQFD
uniref:Uncharacterized protein n=1 Tax=Rhipicephalus zambeziensis TaxID=60191 RepID=A0A224Y8U6_9ACAR